MAPPRRVGNNGCVVACIEDKNIGKKCVRIVILIFGSYGDHAPMWLVGQEAVRRGHQVVAIGNARFFAMHDWSAMQTVDIVTLEESKAGEEKIAENSVLGNFGLFKTWVETNLRRSYDALKQLAPFDDTILFIPNGPGALSALTIREQHAVPVMHYHLDPWSTLDTSRDWSERFRNWTIKKIIGSTVQKMFDEFRRQEGLPRIPNYAAWEDLQVDAACGMYAEFTAKARPFKAPPYPFYMTGFSMTSMPPEPVPPHIETFLASGPPPVVVSKPSWLAKNDRYFRETELALERLNMRGILTGSAGESTVTILRVPFANHRDFLHRGSAFIHHGGAGTAGAGLYAGVPQIVVPQAPMQRDFGHRLKNLGVGAIIDPWAYRAARVAKVLEKLTTSPTVAARCLELAEELHRPGQTSCELVCDAIEVLAKRGCRFR